MHDLWHDVWHAFTHADKGILKLLKDLTVHPAGVYHRYFAGQRKYYFSPVLFYVLMAGISIYAGDQVFKYEDQVNHNNNEFGKFVLDHTKLIGLFLLPAEALITWGFFYKRYNLAETAVFWLFCNGLVFIFKILTTAIYLPFINSKHILDYVFGMVCFGVMFWQLAAAFAWKRSLSAYLLVFILINIIIILYQYAGYYLLFDNAAFRQPVWKMIRDAYSYNP